MPSRTSRANRPAERTPETAAFWAFQAAREVRQAVLVADQVAGAAGRRPGGDAAERPSVKRGWAAAEPDPTARGGQNGPGPD